MRKALLDTSFIMTAARQKIDFFEEFESMGFRILIPEKVIKEIENLSKSKKLKIKENAQLAIKILAKNKFGKIILEGKNTDQSIIKFARENPRMAIATLDEEIKRKTQNQKILIRGKKKIEII